MLWKVIKLPKEYLHKYYARENCSNLNEIFINNCYENNCKLNNIPKECTILNGDKIEECLLDLRKNSADRIIISKKFDGNVINILICELSSGKRKSELIRNKIQNSSQHIIDVFNPSQFEINNFRCCYIGKYEKYDGLIKSKTPITIKVNGISKKIIHIQNHPCGFDFEKLK